MDTTPTREATTPIQILHLEPRREDSALLRNALQAERIACEILRVESMAEFHAAIRECRFDIVVSEFLGNGPDALAVLHEAGSGSTAVPVVYFTSEANREQCHRAVLCGAADIVRKIEPARLPNAVRNALVLAQIRAGHTLVEPPLTEAEQRFRRIADNLGQLFWVVNCAGGEVVFSNGGLERTLALPANHFASRPLRFVEFVHPGDREPLADALDLHQHTGGTPREFRVVQPDGGTRWLRARLFPTRDDSGAVRLAMIGDDMTDAKAAEAANGPEADRWTSVFSVFPDLFFLLDRDGTILDFHAGNPDDLLLRPEEFLGKRIDHLGRATVGASFAEALEQIRRDGDPTSFEYSLACAGSRRHFEARLIPLPDRRVGAFVRDVTPRTETADALRESEMLYHSLVENLPVYLFRKNRAGQITFANQRFCQFVGRSLEQILGQTDHDLFPRELADAYREDDRKVLDSGRVLEMDEEQVGASAERISIHTIKSPLSDARGKVTGVQGVFWDVTARRKAEEQLRETNHQLAVALKELKLTQQQIVQQERLNALGQMSSGIAHDFNNTLMAILGFTELLLMSPEALDDKEKVVGYLKAMATAAKDAATVVKRLNNFYRHRSESEIFPPVDINRLVRQVIAMTQPRWKDEAQARGIAIEIRTALGPVLPNPGHEAELREALVNLIFNSIDAMPRGGIITITSRMAGEAVLLEFSDEGTGMSDEVRIRCFEPFFSTKGQRGTGLGLSMVFGIIQRHQGTIDIETQLGKGTTFAIKLPALKQFANNGGDTEMLGSPSDPMRVLVVDDEPLIRQILAEYLGADGHVVVAAADGREALQRFGESHFDLVLTDRSMPHMNGERLAAAIKQVDPRRPVVLLTGFGDMMNATGEKPDSVDVVMAKPVTLNSLRLSLAEALAGN